MEQEHNCSSYTFTITFPKGLSLADEWRQIPIFLEEFKAKLSQQYLCVGGIIAVEPHRNTSLTHPNTGRNTKAGRPHIHMVLWFMHDFLNPSLQKMAFIFDEIGYNSRIKKLLTPLDVVRSCLYATKERQHPALAKICKTYFNWDSNISIWINQKDCQKDLLLLHKKIPQAHLSQDLFIQCPSTRKCVDNDIQLAELFSKLFALKGLAVKDQNVYARVPGTRFTWQYHMPLRQWLSDQFDLSLPIHYLLKIKESLGWLLAGGAYKKHDPKLRLLPTISPYIFYVEFQDTLYDFATGQTVPFTAIPPNASTLCSEPYPFHQCQPPFRLIALLFALVSNGRVDTIDEKNITTFFETLQTLGGLYHPTLNRKDNPAIYLVGQSNTFKTFLISTILNKLVGQENIDIISRFKGRFNSSILKKDHDQPYILLMDDLRWNELGMSVPDLLNLLDGQYVHTEQKWGTAQGGALKGSIAVTTNYAIGQVGDFTYDSVETLLPYEDRKALKNRLKTISFHPLEKPNFHQIPFSFWQDIEQEALGFSILTNALFLASKLRQTPLLPQSFFQLDQYVVVDPQDPYSLNLVGSRLIDIALKGINATQR